ncbi:MAG: hypothetical protein NZV14_08175 [Bryobacteraceae bacterium]|nr:hypothetical protein [Bryobacteraceae bacterium]MDW8378124.1 hypothetical protein [Bryobacterales bacterium]
MAFRSSLRVSQGKLVRRGGVAVHAAAFLRKRRLVLDSELRENPLELRRILVHELFHFVWLRLSNRIRLEWHCLIQSEFHQRARGELGWSSQWRKAKLQPSDAAARTRKWREYLCESFCDSAASLLVPDHPEMTLAPRFRRRRNQWFAPLMKRQPLPL